MHKLLLIFLLYGPLHLLLSVMLLETNRQSYTTFFIFEVLMTIVIYMGLHLHRKVSSLSHISSFGSPLDLTIVILQHSFLLCFLYATNTNKYESPLVLYFNIIAVYHLLEFYFTLIYRPNQLIRDAFLIYHSIYYQAAFWISMLEYFITNKLYPGLKTHSIEFLLPQKIALCFAGLFIRSAAFHHAGQSFNHLVKSEKPDEQVLVTSGIYKKERHPSYVGYYLYSVVLQLVIGNYLCFIVFAVFLVYFFKKRIETEEYYLFDFFGIDYIRYVRQTRSIFDVDLKGFPQTLKQKLVYKN